MFRDAYLEVNMGLKNFKLYHLLLLIPLSPMIAYAIYMFYWLKCGHSAKNVFTALGIAILYSIPLVGIMCLVPIIPVDWIATIVQYSGLSAWSFFLSMAWLHLARNVK